jgi:membrane-associated phospholipid phosphatase
VLYKATALVAAFLAVSVEASAGQQATSPGPPADRFASSVKVSFDEPDDRRFDLEIALAPQQLKPDPQEKPPLPEHTGFAALWHGTVDDFVAFPQRRSTWAFLAIGAAGAAAAHPADQAVNERLHGNPTASKFFALGKYLGGGVQVAAGVSMYVVGRYVMKAEAGTTHTNKVAHLGFDLVRAQILTQALTYGIKVSVRRDRPTGECCSFPSGHSSATFATAAVIERHLGYRGAIPTLAIASYVAISRLHDNRHYLSDVVFGAALGTASGWTVVGRHGRTSYAFVPVRLPGGAAILLVKQGQS